MDLTLGDSKLNKNNDSLRNDSNQAYLGASLGINAAGNNTLNSQQNLLKGTNNTTLSSRKPEGNSDGQFSDYNEVLKSPLLEAPKLNVTKGGPDNIKLSSLHDD
jgi:hypothetical protein